MSNEWWLKDFLMSWNWTWKTLKHIFSSHKYLMDLLVRSKTLTIFPCCRLYTVDEFSVQTCSKCLLWMPDELFITEIVQNQTLSVKRHLITFSTQNSDIKNPLSSKVNPIFSYQKICHGAFYVLALQPTERRWTEIRISTGTPSVL